MFTKNVFRIFRNIIFQENTFFTKKAPAASRRAHSKSFKQHQQHKNKTRTRNIKTRTRTRTRIIIRIRIRQDIFHTHIFFSNKKTSSIAIYSSPTRRHLFFSNKKTSILVQQEDIYSSPTRRHLFFSNNKTYCSPTRRHVPCPYSIYHVSRADTCLQSIHIEFIRTRHGQNPKKSRFWLFLGIEGWPLGHQILSSLIVFRGFMASDDIDFVEFQKLKNKMSKMVILVIW